MKVFNLLAGISLLTYSVYSYLVLRKIERVFVGLNLDHSVVSEFSLAKIGIFAWVFAAMVQIVLALTFKKPKYQKILFASSVVLFVASYLTIRLVN